MRIRCDVLLYAGRWGVSRHRDWRVVARDAIHKECRLLGRLVTLDFVKAAPNDDGLRVVMQVTADVWCSADTLADNILASLLSGLRPEFDGQIDVEASDVAPSWEDVPPPFDGDSGLPDGFPAIDCENDSAA